MGKALALLSVLVVIVAVGYYYYATVVNPPEYSAIVETKYGKVRGIVGASRDGRKFNQYMGIPYAKPPVGQLRYESPQTPEKWTSVKDAVEYGNACAQVDFLLGYIYGEEDCLYLNVFTPKLKTTGVKPLPVLVWIHGGGFITGSGNELYGPEYFMDEDVTLVTFNYRLGSLGFLNTADGIVRGNMGLKDQSLALKWVQQNIHVFNGDAKRVTLVGQSAGGASVHFQLLSPMSKGLYQKAISMSGNANSLFAMKENPKAQAQRYAKNVNCSTKSTKEMVACLKKMPVYDLMKGHLETAAVLRDGIGLFGPTIEATKDVDTFLPDDPLTMMKKGAQAKVPWMTGYLSEEGLLFAIELKKNESLLDEINADFRRNIARFSFLQDGYATEETAQKTRDFFFGPAKKNRKLTLNEDYGSMTNLVTDLVFGLGTQASIETQSKYSPVYAYFYTYKGEYSFTNILEVIKYKFFGNGLTEFLFHVWKSIIQRKIFGSNNFVVEGACHADEIRILFRGSAYDEINPKDKDYKFSKQLVKLWVDFANNDKSMKIQGHHWQPWNTSKQFLQLDKDVSLMGTPFEYRMNFWRKSQYL